MKSRTAESYAEEAAELRRNLRDARAERDVLRRDAERYRWLRAQHWNTSPLCVVAEPKDAVKLGHCCPSGEYLDIAVDDAMLIGRAVGAA